MQWYPSELSEGKIRDVLVKFTGLGASAPTKNIGQYCSVTRTSAGLYKLTFKEPMGVFVDVHGWSFGADTPGAVKGYTLTYDTYDPTTKTIEVAIWDSTFAAADLAVLQYLTFHVRFQQMKVR